MNPHLIFLPLLEEDETLYSWSAQVHRRCGFTNAVTTSQRLFGSAHAALLHDFPSHLGNLTARTDNLLGSTKSLALAHTLLGHFLVLLPEDEARLIVTGVIEGAMPYLRMKLGIPSSRLGGFHWLKYCPDCVVEDQRMLGRSIWRCSHQIPAAILCPHHRTPLSIAWHPNTPVHRREWITPTHGFSEALSYRVHDSEAHAVLSRLTDLALAFTAMGPAGLTVGGISLAIHRRLDEMGAITANGNIRRQQLASTIHRRFIATKTSLESTAPCSIRCELDALVNSIADRANPSRHPLKQLLAISMLFDNWLHFRETYDLSQSKRHDSLPLQTDDVDQATEQTQERQKIFVQSVRGGKTISAVARTMGISITTGVRWAKIANLPYKSRASKLRPGTQSRAKTLLSHGTDAAEVASRLNVSLTTIQRFLSCSPEIRAAWRFARTNTRQAQARRRLTTAIAAHPGSTLNAIRKDLGGDYAWLYRNDREWLRATVSAMGNQAIQ